MASRPPTILITGATSGIGLEASVKLAETGAKMVLVGRDPARLDAAVTDVKRRGGLSNVSGLLCDFASQAPVRRLAAEFQATHPRLDVLVNNAGSVSPTRNVSEDGIEQTFAVNHLGYFLLTLLLLDLLNRSAPSRIVNVASVGHRQGTMNFDDFGFEAERYTIMKAYSRSKLANVPFTRELARRLTGTGVTVNALHPGAVATQILVARPSIRAAAPRPGEALHADARRGRDVIVHLASGPDLEGRTGGYYERFELVPPSALAQDDQVAKRLWDVSAAFVHWEPGR